MTPELLKYLCDPLTKEPLTLQEAQYDSDGAIISGILASRDGNTYPVKNGIPRFVSDNVLKKSVESFGDEWNYFNFTEFKQHWLTHTVINTFGSLEYFKDKLIVDAGGGSGAQTLWMLEAGARHVIMMDLSHSVDDVVQRNLKPSGFKNYDVIQCSIDMPPIREQSINGLVICHNVIQHTPSVENTAKALYAIVASGSEFAFNCYPLNDQGFLRWVRFHLLYRPLREILSRLPFWAILAYSKFMGLVRLLPGIGLVIKKSGVCIRGDVPITKGESYFRRLKRNYRATVLNTFDYYGSHEYQHHKRDNEIQSLASSLQPDPKKIMNADKYFLRPPPIGCALRLRK